MWDPDWGRKAARASVNFFTLAWRACLERALTHRRRTEEQQRKKGYRSFGKRKCFCSSGGCCLRLPIAWDPDKPLWGCHARGFFLSVSAGTSQEIWKGLQSNMTLHAINILDCRLSIPLSLMEGEHCLFREWKHDLWSLLSYRMRFRCDAAQQMRSSDPTHDCPSSWSAIGRIDIMSM